MNLKDRGVTVGDLLILIIIILTSTIVVKSFNKDKKTTLNQRHQQSISYEKTLISKFYLKNSII